MNARIRAVMWVALLVAWTGFALAATKPMPPEFSVKADPEKVLRDYPLGIITKEDAFVHHGKAVRTITLPNGEEGWVYEVGGTRPQTYRGPTGQEQTVEESGPDSDLGLRTYTLVFDKRGVVVDVLYNEQGRHNGLTALQLQHEAGRDRPGKQDYPPKR